MKTLLTIIATVILGLAIAIGGSAMLIGVDRTQASLQTLTGRLASVVRPPSQLFDAQGNATGGSVLGISEGNNSAFAIQDIQLYQFHKQPSPFIVPTSGIAGSASHLFDPVQHAGIDIWTNISGKGSDAISSKGNPVYAACSGVVTRVYHPNEEIEVICDPVDATYADVVPSLRVKTLYAHMGDAITHQPYHSLRVGQRLTQGELIGYQGNVSSITPWNRVTHLHFGIYDLTRSNRPALNPEPYIGVSTTLLGQIYQANGSN